MPPIQFKTILCTVSLAALLLESFPAGATPPLLLGIWRGVFTPATVLVPAETLRTKVYVSGRVIAQDERAPVSDAAVSLMPQGGGAAIVVAHTLVNGSFFLAAPAPGSYRITIDAGSDYNVLDQPLEVPAAGTGGLDLVLTQPPSLQLELIGVNSQPLHGGTVDVQVLVLPNDHAGKMPPFWLTRPALGIWGAHKVGPDGVVKVIMPHGFAPDDIWEIGIGVRDPDRGCKEVFLDRWPVGKIGVHLEGGVELSGRVVDSAGKGVPGLDIQGVGASANLGLRFLQGLVRTTSDAAGNFVIPVLFRDRYDLGVTLPDAGKRFHIATAGGQDGPVTISPADRSSPRMDTHFFRPGGARGGSAKLELLRQRFDDPPAAPLAVGGKVTASETGEAVAGVTAELMALTPGEATLLDAVQAGPNGVYSLSAPGPGQYFWQVQAPGRSAVEQSIQVPAGGLTLNTPMLKVRDLDIHLLKPDGKPLGTEGVRYWLSYRWPNGSSSNGSGLRPLPDAGYLTMDSPQNVDKLQEFVFGVQVPGVGCGQWRFTHWPEGSVTLPLFAGSTLAGQVVDDAGKDVPNAAITLSPNLPHVPLYTLDGQGRFEGAWAGNYNDVLYCTGEVTGTTDAEGKFSMSQLMYGEYEARVEIPGVGNRYHLVSLRGPDVSIVISPQDRTTPKATFRVP